MWLKNTQFRSVSSSGDLALLQRAVSQHGHQLMIPPHSQTQTQWTFVENIAIRLGQSPQNGHASKICTTHFTQECN